VLGYVYIQLVHVYRAYFKPEPTFIVTPTSVKASSTFLSISPISYPTILSTKHIPKELQSISASTSEQLSDLLLHTSRQFTISTSYSPVIP
jgi:hypothetical protein